MKGAAPINITISCFKLKINPAILLAAIAAAILGFAAEFLALLISAALHEAAHLLTALSFGLKPAGVSVTPIGMAADIRKIELLPPLKKSIVYLSGPLVSLILSLTAFFCGMEFLLFVNATLFAVNLLPAATLDGGRFFTMLTARKTGWLSALKIMSKVNAAVAFFFIIAGIAQVVFYPPNITFICAGCYLFLAGKKEKSGSAFQFFMEVCVSHEKYTARKKLPVRYVAASREIGVKEMLYRLGYDNYCCFQIYDTQGKIFTVSESELIRRVSEHGLSGNASVFMCCAEGENSI